MSLILVKWRNSGIINGIDTPPPPPKKKNVANFVVKFSSSPEVAWIAWRLKIACKVACFCLSCLGEKLLHTINLFGFCGYEDGG